MMLTGRNGNALVWQAVFCLALMGTNYVAFIREASRHRHEAEQTDTEQTQTRGRSPAPPLSCSPACHKRQQILVIRNRRNRRFLVRQCERHSAGIAAQWRAGPFSFFFFFPPARRAWLTLGEAQATLRATVHRARLALPAAPPGRRRHKRHACQKRLTPTARRPAARRAGAPYPEAGWAAADRRGAALVSYQD